MNEPYSYTEWRVPLSPFLPINVGTDILFWVNLMFTWSCWHWCWYVLHLNTTCIKPQLKIVPQICFLSLREYCLLKKTTVPRCFRKLLSLCKKWKFCLWPLQQEPTGLGPRATNRAENSNSTENGLTHCWFWSFHGFGILYSYSLRQIWLKRIENHNIKWML